ncbi:MAG: hypothetical protein ABIX01_11670 [Chitinophagaceae bacterium]
MIRNDILWKGILENLFGYFLRFFYQEHLPLFDFSKGFEFLDKELEQLFPVENLQSPKYVDKLVKVFTTSGAEEWILIHIEVQGYKDKDFANRMFTYFYRILDRYGKKVAAIAIFSDANKKYRPSFFGYEFLGTKNVFEFKTYKILDQDEDQLLNDPNPFAVVILTALSAIKNKTVSDEKLFDLKLQLIRNLLEKKTPIATIRALFNFIRNYVVFASLDNSIKFENEILSLTGNRKTMGIEELLLQLAEKKGELKGEKKGREEARDERNKIFVTNLITSTDFSNTKIASIAGVPETFVQRLRADIQ